MRNKTLSLILLWILLLSGYAAIASAHNAPFPSGYDPTTVVVDTVGEPLTVDPAYAYDTASGEVISNVYETLIFYDTVWTDGPYSAGKADVFKPLLATDVSVLTGPAPYYETFYFKVRSGTATEMFVAAGTAGDVNLFKDGQVYGGLLFVRDPEYAKFGKAEGPITSASSIPVADGKVDRANVPASAYCGSGSPMATTWTAGSTGYVVRGWKDGNGNSALDVGDSVETVRKCNIGLTGLLWNVREYWKVTDANPGPPFTVTVEYVPAKFSDGTALTPQDVEYSFERMMVQDRSGGPAWMFYNPVMDLYGADDPVTDPNFGDKIDAHIGSNATHAWIHLDRSFPELTFLQILSLPSSSIVNKAWCIAKGDFDRDWTHEWQYIWDTWHDPFVSFIEGDMMGTGPYKFDYWAQGSDYSIVKNDAYWDGWPALTSPTSTERIADFVSRVQWRLITGYLARRDNFLAGDSDFTTVPRKNRDDVLGRIVGGEKVRSFYPVEPRPLVDAVFFTFNINPLSTRLGPGFDPGAPYVISEDRIPVDLFSDIHVRRGFAVAFDYDLYLSQSYFNEASQPSDPIIAGVTYDNPAQSKPMFNLTYAVEELKAAWIGHPDDNPETPEGALWDRGMSFTLPFVTTSNLPPVDTMVPILSTNINSLNPKFHVTTTEVLWGSTYLPEMISGRLPIFSVGWMGDYPDPDNFVYPFMFSGGAFSAWQRYSNPRADALITAGASLPDDTGGYNGELDLADPRAAMNNYNAEDIALDPMSHIPPDTRWPRRSIYYELQAIYAEDTPGFIKDQPIERHWEQAWMRGWYYNPVYPGNYFYHIWKAKTHFGDANNDGVVNVVDAATVSASWTKPTPDSTLGPLGYGPQADLTGGTGGTTGSEFGLVVGIPDGKVNVVDAALVSAYWDGPPQGPSHP